METNDMLRQQEQLVAAYQRMRPEARAIVLQLARDYAAEFPAEKPAPVLRLVGGKGSRL